MFIRIDSSSGIPITRQIIDQIRAQCASGDLRAGDRLPSVRALAREVAVNQNTILRVYERLEGEGLIERRHGDGTYVGELSSAAQLKIQHELLKGEVDRMVRHARTIGVSPDEVHRIIDKAFKRPEGEK